MMAMHHIALAARLVPVVLSLWWMDLRELAAGVYSLIALTVHDRLEAL